MGNNVVTLTDLNQEIIRRELEKRKESKIYADNFWEYCKKSDPEFFFDDKTLLMDLANKLQLVKEKKIRKLAVSMYPRAGKSYTISLFCSWLS